MGAQRSAVSHAIPFVGYEMASEDDRATQFRPLGRCVWGRFRVRWQSGALAHRLRKKFVSYFAIAAHCSTLVTSMLALRLD